MKKSIKLEDNELWVLVSEIAEYSYSVLDHFPEEEKWGMQSKIRQRAFEATSDVAEAVGSVDPRDVKWHLGLSRRSIFGLKNALRLAQKAGYLEVAPEFMIKIDKASELMGNAISAAENEIPLWFKEMEAPAKDGKNED